MDCQFISCRMSDSRLTGSNFRNCLFQDCELTLLKVERTGFSNCAFKNTMLQGINFSESANSLFYPDFISCEIRHCFFSNMDLKEKGLYRVPLPGLRVVQDRFQRCRFQKN